MDKKNLSLKDKQNILKSISDMLTAEECVIFAYVFGSFVSEDGFQDVDIGIFVDAAKLERSPLDFELRAERELEAAVRMPVDVRIINSAPLSFVYNVLKRRIVVADKDASLRADFEGAVYKKYFDFLHLRKEYVREIINAPL